MSRYLISLAEQCKKAIQCELGIYYHCKTPIGSHCCDVWVSDEDREAFEKAFIEGSAGKKYGLGASFVYNSFGNKKLTYSMSRLKK